MLQTLMSADEFNVSDVKSSGIKTGLIKLDGETYKNTVGRQFMLQTLMPSKTKLTSEM